MDSEHFSEKEADYIDKSSFKRTHVKWKEGLNSQEEAYQARKMIALGTMISGVAHELNNPLSSISMNAQLLHNSVNNLKNTSYPCNSKDINHLLEYINLIQRASTQGSRIINDLLKYSRRGTLNIKTSMLSPIIENTFDTVKKHYNDNNTRLEVSGDHSLLFLCDQNKIEQLFINLFKNAFDAIYNGPNSNNGIVKVTYNKNKGMVIINVMDNGTGIHNEDLKRIFDPFFTTKGPEVGTGLGLGISYEIVKQHRGEIYAKNSVELTGAHFVVKFPLSS